MLYNNDVTVCTNLISFYSEQENYFSIQTALTCVHIWKLVNGENEIFLYDNDVTFVPNWNNFYFKLQIIAPWQNH